MFLKSAICFGIISLITVSNLNASNSENNTIAEQDWAIGMVLRTASIPFATDEKTVMSLIPLLFYEGDRFFMRGIEGGFKVYRTTNWQFSALGRMHFFDFPKEYQNLLQGDNVDWGVQAQYKPIDFQYLELELMSDWTGNFSSNFRLGLDFYKGKFRIDPFFQLKYKSKKYNSYYFGLTLQDVDPGIDMSLGVVADYHVGSNFYFYGAGMLTLLDRNVRNVEFVNSDFHGQVLLGVGFSSDRSKPRKEKLANRPFLRLAHGWATPSALAQIIRFKAKPDSNNNKLTSLFYGYPLTDELFGLPLEIYLTPGFVWHWASDVQSNAQEVVIAIKLFYTIRWPIRWRFGAAEGMSYVNRIPYVEKTSLKEKGYRPSNLMNFLDFSLDLNLGDIFGGDQLKKWWLGYSIHHRSSIFETAQHFGRISGGSNFQTICLQWHY